MKKQPKKTKKTKKIVQKPKKEIGVITKRPPIYPPPGSPR